MTESHTGYRVPPSQMDDVPIDNRDGGNRSRSQYGKPTRCLNAANHWDFFMRYKITVLTGIISILALLFFSASIIYMALQSAEGFPSLQIEKIIEEDPVTELKQMKNYDAEEIDRRENTIRRQVYEIIPESFIQLKKREVRKIRKRETQLTSKNVEDNPRENIILHSVRTGSKIPRQVEVISNPGEFMKDIFDNDADEGRNNDKREIEKMEKLSSCQRRSEHCKSVLDNMHALIQQTGDNVHSLDELVTKMKLQTNGGVKDPNEYEDFLQCVECGELSTDREVNDSAAVVNESDGTPAVYEQHAKRGKQAHVKKLKSITALLDNNSRDWSSYSGSASSEEYRSKGKDAKSHDIQITDDNSVTKTETHKSEQNVQRTVQLSKSKKVENGTVITNVVRNTTIIKTQPEAELGKEKQQSETSTMRTLNFGSLKSVRPQPTAQANDPSGPTGPGSQSTVLHPSGDQSSSVTTESTKVEEMQQKFREPNGNAQADLPKSWNNEGETVAAFGPRVMTKPEFEHSKIDRDAIISPTAETLKNSQQGQFTPGMSWMPYPVCFFGIPPSGAPTPFKQSMHSGMAFPPSSPGAANYPFAGNYFPLRSPTFPGQAMNPGFVPMQYQQQQQSAPFIPSQQFHPFQQGFRVGPSGPGGRNFLPNYGNLPTGPGAMPRTPYYCTYIQTPTFHLPSAVSEFQRSADASKDEIVGAIQEWPVSDPTWTADGSMYSGNVGECDSNSYRCFDGSHCVPKTLWCDGNVNCPDASDEIRCSCRARISKDRICDGYFDCPHGEDELGCFGCPKNTFSCEDWTRRYQKENCVPLSQRCDGVQHCANGKDEKECNILTGSYIEDQNQFTVGYADGFLHKNWQGRWYPVCHTSEEWAADACLSETCVPTNEKPLILVQSVPPGTSRGPYIFSSGPSGELKIVPTCFDKAIYVNCPQIPCGMRDIPDQNPSHYDPYEDSIVASPQNPNNETSRNAFKKVIDEIEKLPNAMEQLIKGSSHSEAKNGSAKEIVRSESRIVGGKVSQPKAWPFLVAIFVDGYFHCGGAIVDPEWILTAAHCVDGFPSRYYEVTAGLLRRYSFSPTAQIRRADSIKIHPEYDRITMKNDLALIRLSAPLHFNRWIRATCLPKSSKTESYWKNAPLPDTTCVVIGWGKTFADGPHPDQLREVEIPILPECKYPEEQNDAEICAGLPQGGRDSCQGDSGGPLLCKYPNKGNQWYVAGIVSHGTGCALPNEPGAYTKVSRFADWINEIIRTREILGQKPQQICPGFSCSGGLGKCIPMSKRCDKVVNCLDAEDEMNCRMYKEFAAQNNTKSGRSGSEWASEVTTGFPNEMGKKNAMESDRENNVAASKESARHSVFTMDEEENSATTGRVETITTTSSATGQKNITDATSVNGTNSEASMTTTSEPQSTSQQSNESNRIARFDCTRIIQTITINERCNHVFDCEDGTDEMNCTCKDYLVNSYPTAICDGHVDCYDGSDEANCTNCKEDQFVCSRSGKCISQSKVCDHHIDCPYMEDELDCFVLTNGDYVHIDLDKRPHLNLEGVLTQWRKGVWRPACQQHNATVQARLSNEICVYFGFRSAESVEEVSVRDTPIPVRRSTKDYVFPYEYPPAFEEPGEGVKTCRGLYVRCKPVLSADTNHLIATNSKTKNLSYLWPWQAAIFVEGRYHCPAILLEHSWLLASSRCVEDLDLTRNYTVALLGLAPTYLYVDGPYQQMASIDAIKNLPKLDAALLHLEYPVNMTRYVQPIFVQKKILPATRKDVCVATGVDEKYRTKTTLLQPEPKNCPACHRCYKNATIEDCRNKTSSNWSGTIVCRGSGTWYPAAIFHDKDLLCGFQTVQTLTSIDYGNAHFTEIMDEDLKPTVGPVCSGLRCRLGNCIASDKICDGIDDCRDGWDEGSDFCLERQCEDPNCVCKKGELRCATSGECIPKESFCNYERECEDGSDEPATCTCANYLKVTAPERLCDNIRDCFDKTDESAEYCSCKDASFKCARSANVTETCVSQDFVCDGENDCPNGEDEEICRSVKGTLKDPRGTGQVLRRSFGVWHSECFPSRVRSSAAADLCKSMGYESGTRLDFGNETERYGPALVPEVDEFYMIRLNRKTWLNIRDPKPIVTLVPPKETCHRAFVKCT